MNSFLTYMDLSKEMYIKYKSKQTDSQYLFADFYFYREIEFIVDASIVFNQLLCAVKLAKTQILFVDRIAHRKVYFSDTDICEIIIGIKNLALKAHLQKYLKNIIEEANAEKTYFIIQSRMFEINSIPFKHEFNDILCLNPADIPMNGNDLIALINLVLEKDRTDSDPHKIIKTAKKFLPEKY